MTALSASRLARMVDHTLLTPEATAAQVGALCAEAAELGVATVCVSPSHTVLAAAGPVPVAVVVGFPSGAHRAAVKAQEAALAWREGAVELDMVMDLGAAAAGDWPGVQRDIAAVREAVPRPVVLKVILETALLDAAGIRAACSVAEACGADFVKTSTGFHPSGGATVEAVLEMRASVGDRLGIKASGGIRTYEQACAMVAAGATRLGLSATRAVLDGARQAAAAATRHGG